VKRATEENRYDVAAADIVKELEVGYPDRQYAVWKWWEVTFGDRADYMELSRRIGDSFFALYQRASLEDRRIIAAIFGRPTFDVSLPAERLRAEIEGPQSRGANELTDPAPASNPAAAPSATPGETKP
jgi:hypothetical protein